MTVQDALRFVVRDPRPAGIVDAPVLPAGPVPPGPWHGPMVAPWRTPAGPDGPPRIALPGRHDMTPEQYHDPAVTGDWISNSDARAMSAPGCPAQWRYDRDHGVRKVTPAFTRGKLAHLLVLGAGEQLAVRPAKWADWRTNAAKAWRAEQFAAGRIIVTSDEYDVAAAMAAAILEHEEAAAILAQPGQREAALFWIDPHLGVRRRAMLDHLPDPPTGGRRLVLADYKTTEHPCPDDDMQRSVYRFGYHRQASGYIDAVEALGLAPWGAVMVFLFQSTTAPYLVTPVQLSERALQIGRIEHRRALESYARCLRTGEWPGYGDGITTVELPPWIERLYDGEVP